MLTHAKPLDPPALVQSAPSSLNTLHKATHSAFCRLMAYRRVCAAYPDHADLQAKCIAVRQAYLEALRAELYAVSVENK